MKSLLVVLSVWSFGGLRAEDQMLLDQVVAAAEKTAARLSEEPARWMVRHDIATGFAMEVAMEDYHDESRYTFRFVERGNPKIIGQVTIIDGHWFVSDGNNRGKYRPFEAPLPFPTAVLLMNKSQIAVFNKEMRATFDVINVERSDDEHVMFRARVTGLAQANLQLMVRKIEDLVHRLEEAGEKVPADTAQQLVRAQDVLANGSPVIVERKTGMILVHGIEPRMMHFRHFEWLGKNSKPDWGLDPSRFEDHSRPFSAEEMKDVIQIGWNAIWQPGSETGGDSELMLLHVKTGEVRRVPYPHGIAVKGSFSQDRMTMYIGGFNAEQANLSPYSIDVRTGTAKQIGGELASQGLWLDPEVSPEGNRLSAIQILRSQGLSWRLHVFDLATNSGKAIGQPMDAAFFSWRPDGNALFCVEREAKQNEDVPTAYLAEVTLDGKARRLREGDFVCVLPSLKRLLFQDVRDNRLWKTCDFSGQDVQEFGDGFQGFGFPDASDDGRLVMMKFEKGKSPIPYVVDVATKSKTPVRIGPGLWSRPAWK